MRKPFGIAAVAVAVTIGAFVAVGSLASGSPSRVGHVLVRTKVVAHSPHVGTHLSLPAAWRGVRRIEWLRCGKRGWACRVIPGATHRSYIAHRADVGHRLRAYALLQGSTVALSQATASISRPLPVNTSLPTISDTSTVGGSLSQPYVSDVLTGSTGTWKWAKSYTYQWDLCTTTTNCTPISGATSTAYTIPDADVGDTIEFIVTAYNY